MKSHNLPLCCCLLPRRSCEGAWIEIGPLLADYQKTVGRSCEGAWIEMLTLVNKPLRILSRSCEGAWIEIRNVDYKNFGLSVAPARERGLKCA